MRGRVLVAGFTTRHVAQSAYHAGYEVFAIDHFCDQDLTWYTKGQTTFEELVDLPEKIGEMCSEHRFDILVVTSGAETISTTIPLFGTSPANVERYLDKLEIQHFFEEFGIPHPALAGPEEYPCMIKPRRGAGGWRNQVISSQNEKKAWEELFPDVPYICQHLVQGIPASVSCISNGTSARAIATNEQMLRGGEIQRAYGFSGAITPFVHPMAAGMIACAERAAACSGCIGSLGVDFVLGDDVWAIEINPRFQATLDTVEMATGINLFDLHISACMGHIPPAMPAYTRYAARKIVFAEHDMVVRDDLKHLAPAIADIPWVGSEYEEGDAVLSAYGRGRTRSLALQMLDKTITDVRRYMNRW